MKSFPGDFGATRDFQNQEVSKSSIEIEILGSFDELFAVLQFVATRKLISKNAAILQKVLEIFPGILEKVARGADFPAEEICEKMENEIDEIAREFQIQKFQTFADSPSAAILNFARTVCRRCERVFFRSKNPPENLGKFLNRLSKLLFFAAVREKFSD